MGNSYEQKHGRMTQQASVDKCSYIKLGNIPTMLDINGIQPDPIDEHLQLSAIDYETLQTISKFTAKNKLGKDLAANDDKVSDAFDRGQEEDDDSMSDDEDEQMAQKARQSGTGFIQGSTTGKKTGRCKLIGRKVQADNSAVSQLRKALQSIHINQRVVSTKIVLAKSRIEPIVSIDGVE